VLLKSRRRLDLLNPDPHAWTDDDLAAGLSRTMRWGGASRWEHPLSVAQHSLTVLTIREADGALTPGEALRELLHDVTEFMLGWDCITPLKAQLGISLLLDRTGYRAMLRESRAENMEQKLENLGELIAIAGGFHSAREFLDHAALATNREREGDEDVVSLMTLHKAKGLEFPHVFLPAFEAGIIPSSYGDVDEERRLAYVALTRGMRQVRISWALYRRGPTEPSPFVDAIPERSRVFLSRPNPKHLSPRARAGLRHIAGRLRHHG
jgi:superfamily I DNA/RNA helicase